MSFLGISALQARSPFVVRQETLSSTCLEDCEKEDSCLVQNNDMHSADEQEEQEHTRNIDGEIDNCYDVPNNAVVHPTDMGQFVDDEMHPHLFFRLIHRARSKSQRRRVYTWTVFFILLMFLFIYSQHDFFISRTGAPPQLQADFAIANGQAMPGEDSRLPRRGLDMKLLESKDTLNSDNVHNTKLEENGEVQSQEDDSRSDLLPDLAPSIVHFLWCGKGRYFEYRHYLALKRANDIIKPDKILFHYIEIPMVDFERYYDWFNHSLMHTDHMVLRQLNLTSCDTSGPRRYMLVLSLLEYFGGIFIPEDAILVDFPVYLRASSFVSGVVAKTMSFYQDGIIVAKKDGFISPSSQNGLNVVLASGRSVSQGTINPCGNVEHYNLEDDGDCICVKVESEIFPSDIWSSETRFSMLARLASYGLVELKPHRSLKFSIPRIGHYICWDCELKFNTYLSVMSALYVAGLSKVYIHGLKEPSGVWWQRLQGTERVVAVNRQYPEPFGDKATMTQELAQGIMRMSILLKYGGVYCDSKVIWTNVIPEEYFSYETIAAPDWRQYGAWPDGVSHTTIMAKKNSEYLQKLRNLHHQFPRARFWFVDQFLSYKMVEKNPSLLYLNRRLQVKCLNHNCHPAWEKGYKVPMNENPPGPNFNWQNDTLSIYWDVFPDLELDTVKYTSGLIVDASRRALKMAGVSVQELTRG